MNDLTKSLFSVGIATGVLVAAEATVITSGVMAPEGKPLLAQTTRALEEQAFLEARRAINREEFELAAELFAAFRDPASNFTNRYKADSYYWEAFARYRLGDLPEALVLLDALEGGYDEYRNYRGQEGRLHDEVVDLRLRIRRQQAEQGDPQAAEEVLSRSEALLHPESSPREYAAALAAYQAQSDSARQEYAAALEAQRERTDSARREYAAALEAQRARSDSARQEYAAALEAQRARSDSARREYAAALEAQQTRSIPLARSDLATVELVRTAADTTRGHITALQSGLVRVNSVLRSFGASVQTTEGCEDESVQQAALTALLRLETERMASVRSVLERNDDCSTNLRWQAVNWLSRQGTEEAERELISIAESHPDSETREGAVMGLRRFPTRSAVRALSGVLVNSDDSDLQSAAIEALRRSVPEEANHALITLATDTSNALELREEALAAFGRRSDVTAESLMQLYGTEGSQGLETAILQSLGRRAPQVAEEGFASWVFERAMDKESSVEVRTAALEAWSRSPLVDLQHLPQSYDELEEPDLKDRIFYALYRKAQSDGADAAAVVDKMIELARGETDPEVQEKAIQWIGRTGSERAVEFLLELLRQRPGDPSVPEGSVAAMAGPGPT